MQPCKEWKASIKDAQACFGGKVDAGSVTVATFFNGTIYVVKIGVYSSGMYNRHAFEALEQKYRRALEDLFPMGSISRTELRELVSMEKEAGSPATTQ